MVACWLFISKRLLFAELADPLGLNKSHAYVRIVELCFIYEAGVGLELVIVQWLQEGVTTRAQSGLLLFVRFE